MTAKIVEGQFRGPGRPPKYDWAKWSDGKVREQDCDKIGVSAESFRGSVYDYANRHDMQAETSVSGNKVRFRIFDKEPT